MTAPRYKLARKIATGGMAEVFLAIQQGLGGFEKLLVVKRILPHLCQDGQFIQMFLDEARLAASLSHPNIVEIFDIQRDSDGFLIAMEYLSGEDILFLLRILTGRGEKIPVPIVCHMISHAASGLSAAHGSTDAEGRSREVVHRDITPGNIIVTYEGITKLVDFGVAKANVANIYTRPGTLKGKLGYTSPEQVQHLELDGRSDLFSLGVVTWQMLTGRRLFGRSSEASVIKAVMEQEIPPPSEFNDQVPPILDKVVLTSLERDRGSRVQSASELCALMEQVSQENSWGTTGNQVGKWMRSALSERRAERMAMERQVTLEARGTATPPPNTTLLPLFSGGTAPAGITTTPSVGQYSSVVQVEKQCPRVGLIVSITIVVTLILVCLVGAAFWMGSQSREGADSASSPVLTVSPVAKSLDIETRKIKATPLQQPDGSSRASEEIGDQPVPPAKEVAPATVRPAGSKGHGRRPSRPRPGKGKPKEPAPDPTPEITSDPVPVPKPEPAPKPVLKPKPKPVLKPKPKPKSKPVPTHGTLSVTSDASGYLFVDGENTGKTTPVKMRLPVGEHEVVVLFKGSNLQVKQKVRIKPGKVIKIRLKGAP